MRALQQITYLNKSFKKKKSRESERERNKKHEKKIAEKFLCVCANNNKENYIIKEKIANSRLICHKK